MENEGGKAGQEQERNEGGDQEYQYKSQNNKDIDEEKCIGVGKYNIGENEKYDQEYL